MNEQVLPGQRLKAERNNQGLSEDDVSASLRLSRSYLRALEADDYERLPEPTFIKGYLRNYAKLLGLPPEELAGAYERLRQDVQPEPEQDALGEDGTSSSGMPVWLWPAAAGLLLVILLVWWSGDETPGPETGQVPAQQTEQTQQTQQSVILPEDELASDPVEEPPTAATDPADELLVVDPDTVSDRLAMRFDDECWVEVHEVGSGELVYQGQQSAGSELELEGDGPFRLTLGNASALSSLRYNDQSLTPPSGPSGRVVRVNVP